MKYSEMKEYVASISNCDLSRKDMIESHESLVIRCEGELESANEDCQKAIFSRAPRKRKTEVFNYASRCLMQYLEAFSKLTAVKLFYKLEEKKQ